MKNVLINNELVIAVLVNYNQNDYTIKCIESLLNCNYPNLKIILVENGSTIENVKLLEKLLPNDSRLKYRRLINNIGYSQGVNYGLSEGALLKPDYFLIMNNDTIIEKYAIDELVKTCVMFKRKAIVTGKVYNYDEPEKLQIVGYELKNKKLLTYKQLGMNEFDSGQHDFVKERDMIDDVFVLHPIGIYKNIGGYSSYFWINGVNIDMGLRVKKHGYKLVYTPKAKLWHQGSVSMGGRNMNPKMAYWNIQSSLILRYIYLDKSSFAIYYLTIVNSVIRTFLKSFYLKVIKDENISDYAKAKYKGLTYFNRWVFVKKNNDGYNPF